MHCILYSSQHLRINSMTNLSLENILLWGSNVLYVFLFLSRVLNLHNISQIQWYIWIAEFSVVRYELFIYTFCRTFDEISLKKKPKCYFCPDSRYMQNINVFPRCYYVRYSGKYHSHVRFRLRILKNATEQVNSELLLHFPLKRRFCHFPKLCCKYF